MVGVTALVARKREFDAGDDRWICDCSDTRAREEEKQADQLQGEGAEALTPTLSRYCERGSRALTPTLSR
jgi:hypothetical protein